MDGNAFLAQPLYNDVHQQAPAEQGQALAKIRVARNGLQPVELDWLNRWMAIPSWRGHCTMMRSGKLLQQGQCTGCGQANAAMAEGNYSRIDKEKRGYLLTASHKSDTPLEMHASLIH